MEAIRHGGQAASFVAGAGFWAAGVRGGAFSLARADAPMSGGSTGLLAPSAASDRTSSGGTPTAAVPGLANAKTEPAPAAIDKLQS